MYHRGPKGQSLRPRRETVGMRFLGSGFKGFRMGHRLHTRISYDSHRIVCDRFSQGIFNLARMKNGATRRLLLIIFKQINVQDNNTLQLNHINNTTWHQYANGISNVHKSDYGHRLIEVPSSLCFEVCSMCTVTR